MTKARFLLLGVIGLCCALAVGRANAGPATAPATAPFTAPAQGDLKAAPCGYYTGTDDAGDFQAALQDAVNQAVAAAPCCDRQISYTVINTSGVAGGFIGDYHVISVTIYACVL